MKQSIIVSRRTPKLPQACCDTFPMRGLKLYQPEGNMPVTDGEQAILTDILCIPRLARAAHASIETEMLFSHINVVPP